MITIREAEGELFPHVVFDNDKVVGNLHKFCCGIDFRINGYPKALFSILKITDYADEKLIVCCAKLLSIKIPDRRFHWNFTFATAHDYDKLKDYEVELNSSSV